jgi:hypothetical protein
MTVRRIALIALPLLLIAGLTACTPDGTDPAPADGAAGGGTAACLADRTWVLDLPDLTAQLAEQMSSNGLNVTESSAEGRQTFFFGSDGNAQASLDSTFTLGVDSGDGIVITVVQTHSGSPSGAWELDGDTVVFADWDVADYAIQNSILVNGIGADAPITLPDDTLDGTDLTITCEGDSLSTKAAASPFTQHWNAEN